MGVPPFHMNVISCFGLASLVNLVNVVAFGIEIHIERSLDMSQVKVRRGVDLCL